MNICKCLKGGRRQMDKARLFLVVRSYRTRSNDIKLEHRKFRSNMLKKFFMVRMTEHWNKLPRELVESPSMEIFKTHPDKYLCDLLWGTYFFRGLDLMVT